jgi:DNA polymerase-4
MHVDMNSYFATVEQQSNPKLRWKPVCVAGKVGQTERTVCCAASIEAKKFGIKSGFPVWEAKNLCPQIIIVPADYHKYQFVSSQVFKILESFTPVIEIFSIDEAFLDLSHINSIDKIISIANSIKARIQEDIGDYLKCSVGISYNKLLAKLASEMQKPDGLTIIDKDNVDKILAQTPIEDLCGVGRRLQARLNSLGIHTAKEMGDYPLEKLIKLFGPHQGKLLYLMGQGKDTSPVLPYFEMSPEKSFGHSHTLPRGMSSVADTQKVLLKLSEKVARRMRHNHFFGRTIHVYARFLNWSGVGKRTTLKNPVNDGVEIYRIAKNMLGKDLPSVRAVGVSMSNLVRSWQVSGSILQEDQRSERLILAQDEVNDKYGEFTVFPAALAKIKDKIEAIPDGRNKRFNF